MPDRILVTNEGAMSDAELISIGIANPDADPDPLVGKLRLFDFPLVPDVTTTQADFEAAETLLGGYPVGGYDIDKMFGPSLSSAGGALITTPSIEIAYSTDPGAVLGGAWIEKSDGTMGPTFIFDPPRSLQALGDGFVFIRQLLYDRNT